MNATAVSSFPCVHIVGCGLLGTSIGLALTQRGVAVTLEDSSPAAVDLARDYGAGDAREDTSAVPSLVVVATPPDVVGSVVSASLRAFPEATVIDVASVKKQVYADVSGDAARFVGTHPMAGRERGGAVSARSDLFTGRPWVICEGEEPRRSRVREFVQELGGIPVDMDATQHDEAVALVSHLPQIVASVSASRLGSATPAALSLAGAGIRDVTRVAASDPALWVQILAANSTSVLPHVKAVRADLDELISALENTSAKGARAQIASRLHSGVAGVSALPGKHGVSSELASLLVVIDDTPGQLARLLTQLGDWGINLEDLRLEHSPGANIGFAELSVSKNVVSVMEQKLVEAGWKISGETE